MARFGRPNWQTWGIEFANSGALVGKLRAPNTFKALSGSRAGCPAASLPPPIPASCRRPAGARLPAPNPSRTSPNPFPHRSQPILPTPHCPGRKVPPTHRPRWQARNGFEPGRTRSYCVPSRFCQARTARAGRLPPRTGPGGRPEPASNRPEPIRLLFPADSAKPALPVPGGCPHPQAPVAGRIRP